MDADRHSVRLEWNASSIGHYPPQLNWRAADGSWSSSERAPRFGRFIAPWSVDVLARGEAADVTHAQYIFHPGGEEDLSQWFVRWLPDLWKRDPRELQRLVGFAESTAVQAHPLFLELGAGVHGVEMCLPVLTHGPSGMALQRIPVRFFLRETSPISMVVWGTAEQPVVPPPTAEYGRLLSEVRKVDFSAGLSLRLSNPKDVQEAQWWYEYEVAAEVEAALTSVGSTLAKWEQRMVSTSLELELRTEVRRLASLRACAAGLLVCLGPYHDFDAPQADTSRKIPLDAREAVAHLLAIAERVRSAVPDLESRAQGSTALLSQLTAAQQLEQAQADANAQRGFQRAVATLASLAVLPGVIAAGAEASRWNVETLPLFGLMGASAVLTLVVLWTLLRRT